MIFVYKLLHGFVGLDTSKFFVRAHDSRTRGHAMKLQIGYSRLLLRRATFSQRIISFWNDLNEGGERSVYTDVAGVRAWQLVPRINGHIRPAKVK